MATGLVAAAAGLLQCLSGYFGSRQGRAFLMEDFARYGVDTTGVDVRT